MGTYNFGNIPDKKKDSENTGTPESPPQKKAYNFGDIPDKVQTSPTESSPIPAEEPTETPDPNFTYGMVKGPSSLALEAASNLVPEETKEVYDFAKKGKSVFEKNLYGNYLDKSIKAADDFTQGLTDIYNSAGRAIGHERELAEARGVKFDVSDTLKKVETEINSAINRSTVDPQDQAKAKNFLKKQLGNLKDTESLDSFKVVKPVNPIISSPEEIAFSKLQDDLDKFRALSEGVPFAESPPVRSGNYVTQRLDPIPDSGTELKSTTKTLTSSVDKVPEKMREINAKAAAKGETVQLTGQPTRVGDKVVVPYSVVSEGKEPASKASKTLVQKIPEGLKNDIQIVKNSVIDSVYKKQMSPTELKDTITNFQNFIDSTDDKILKNEVRKAVKELRGLENTISADMKKYKDVYGGVKDFSEDYFQGLKGYFGEGGDVSKMQGQAPTQAKEYMSKVGRALTSETPSPSDIKAKDTMSELARLQELMKSVDPDKAKQLSAPIEGILEDARRLNLGGLAADTITEEAVEAVGRANPRFELFKSGGKRIADIVGKIPENFPIATKAVSLGVPGALTGLSTKINYDEALASGMAEEEALAYASAIEGVDYAAGSAAVPAAKLAAKAAPGIFKIPAAIGAGVAVGAAPLVRELGKMVDPESYKDKLKLYRKMKKDGSSSAVALAAVTAQHSLETASAPLDLARGVVRGVSNLFSSNDSGVVENFTDDQLKAIDGSIKEGDSLSVYKPQLQEIMNEPDPKVRKRALHNLQTQPAFQELKRRLKKGEDNER